MGCQTDARLFDSLRRRGTQSFFPSRRRHTISDRDWSSDVCSSDLFLATLLGLLPTPDLMPHLMSYADRVLPGDAASLLKKTLGEVVSGASGGLLSVGVLAALLGASSGMLSIMKALNAAYGIADSRSWWRRRLIAITLTIGVSLFILTPMLLLVFGGRMGDAVGD